MNNTSVVAVFCEDAREEVGGTTTLVGILPDNVEVPALPSLFPKLAIYVRVHLPIDAPTPNYMNLLLRGEAIPAGSVIGSFSPEEITKIVKDAGEQGSPYAGLVFTAKASPFPVAAVGRLAAIVDIDGTEWDAGGINIKMAAD